MATFKKVFEGTKSLLDDTWDGNFANTVQLKTKTAAGPTFTTKAKVSGKGSASVKAEYSSGAFSVKKFEVGSSKVIKAEFELKDAVPNTKLSFKGEDSTRAAVADPAKPGSGAKAVIGATYTTKDLGVTLDVDAINNFSTDVSALFKYEGFSLGGQAKAQLTGNAEGASALKDYNILLGYTGSDYTVSAHTTKTLSTLNLNYLHKVSKDIEAGAKVAFPRDSATAKDFDIALGGSYKCCPDVKVTAKAVAGNGKTGHVYFAYDQKLNALAKLTLFADFDARNINSDTHDFGLKLSLSA